MGAISEGVHFATRDNRRAFAANAGLGDPTSLLGHLIEGATGTSVTREHDLDGLYTEAELSAPHSHYRLRWACRPEEAWLLAEHPKWLAGDDELARYRPKMLAVRPDVACEEPPEVELPVTCDMCRQLLDGPGRRRDDGRTAVVPIPAGVTLVLVALCCWCVESLIGPDHLVSWNDLT